MVNRYSGYLPSRQREMLVSWARRVSHHLTTEHPAIGSRLGVVDLSPEPAQGLEFRFYGALPKYLIDPMVIKLGRRIKKEFDIRPQKEYLSLHLTETGQGLGRHIDPLIQGSISVRFNLILKQATEGGSLWIGEHPAQGQWVELSEGDLYSFRPDRHWHEIGKVSKGERLMLSYGFLLEKPPWPKGFEEERPSTESRGFLTPPS